MGSLQQWESILGAAALGAILGIPLGPGGVIFGAAAAGGVVIGAGQAGFMEANRQKELRRDRMIPQNNNPMPVEIVDDKKFPIRFNQGEVGPFAQPKQNAPQGVGAGAFRNLWFLNNQIVKFQKDMELQKPTNKGPELIRAGSEAAFNFGRNNQNQANQPINQVQANTKKANVILVDIKKALSDGLKLKDVALVEGFA